jgi:hypothetical protein
MKTDPRIDELIAKAAPFARPILTHLRALMHEAVPEIEETIKWGMPLSRWAAGTSRASPRSRRMRRW